MNRFEEIETFVRTVEAGTFTAAAQQLGVAKSLVSRRISELEKRLGAQLFTRTTRTLSLTEEGRALHTRATGLLAEWHDMESVGGDPAGVLSGRIRISLPLSFGLMRVGPLITAFSALHPAVQCDVQFSDRKVDLIAEGFDLALRIGDLPDSTLKARKLATLEACVVASPAFVAEWGKPTTADGLASMPELRFGLRERKRWQYLDPTGTAGEVELAARMVADSGEFLRDAATAGLGVALLPRFIAEDALASGDLVEVLTDHHWATLDLHAVYPATSHLPLRVRAFIDYLIAHCGGAGATAVV